MVRVLKKCLTSWFGYAKMVGMKTQNTSGLVSGSFQPASSLAVLCGVAGEWLASGVRSARSVCMNRSADMRITGGLPVCVESGGRDG